MTDEEAATVTTNFDKAIDEIVNQKVQIQPHREPTQVLSYEKLMDIGARILKQKTDEQIALRSSYEVQRTELMDSYRVRMERLKMEGEEELRSLDHQHIEQMNTLGKLINKLRTLREG
jgi:ATP-dependent 26S proteasome regulatory subunit